MASRLALKYGLVSEEDRLANSSDAVLVTEPTTGSKARTKGSLYLVVTSRALGGRTRDACRLVADTIRREYYYDESAGIAIVIEKAIIAANRRLRHAREGSSLAPGSLGVAVAVVRANELYVATCGDADSYLIRSARLLMPEHDSGPGLPGPDGLKVGVWRGDFTVGDSLVLCSRNLVEAVGTEELKNAVVTLHPQSAVEHLHHLFVAAGGDGSDAVLAIEATEVSLSRVEHRLVPVNPSEPLAGAPMRSPIPLADQIAGAATAVQDRALAARLAVRAGVSRAVGSVLDLMPRRRTSYKRIGTAANQRETQRRAAIAVLAFIGVIAVLGVALYFWGPFKQESPISRVTEGEAAFADARTKTDQVFGSADLVHTDPPRALQLLQGAWTDLDHAQSAAVDQASIESLRARVSTALDRLYSTVRVTPAAIYSAQQGNELGSLVRGPDDAAYVIAGTQVIRIDPTSGSIATIVQEGAGVGAGIGAPKLLAHGGPDLLILDAAGTLWRWRPSDALGGGTLGQVSVAGDQVWTDVVVDIETFVINPDQGLYRLYVPYPPTTQVLRYDPTADGSGFSAPNPYFVSQAEDVASFRQLLVDGDVYAVTRDKVVRYFNGRQSTAFDPPDPPDDGDVRPGHDYHLIAATGTRGVGNLFVWDATHERVLAFDKTDGTYVEQFVAAEGAPAMADLSGMYIVERGTDVPPILVFARPDGIYQVVLVAPDVVATPPPAASFTPEPSSEPTPPQSITPATPTPEPTLRPRRTPRPIAAAAI